MVQDISSMSAPTFKNENERITLYSGSFAGLVSPVKVNVPLIVADIDIKKGYTLSREIPGDNTTFIYVIAGDVQVGDKNVGTGEVGGLNVSEKSDLDEIKIKGLSEYSRFVLYSGKPTKDNIVSYGPFIADTNEQIVELYKKYKNGELPHISTVNESQKVVY